MAPFATDAKHTARLGVPTFGFSPLRLDPAERFLERFHGVDERVADALRGLPVLYDVVRASAAERSWSRREAGVAVARGSRPVRLPAPVSGRSNTPSGSLRTSRRWRQDERGDPRPEVTRRAMAQAGGSAVVSPSTSAAGSGWPSARSRQAADLPRSRRLGWLRCGC
jgi:hypothetical protein